MIGQTPTLRFALDGRMLGEGGTGVATYAHALKAALDHLGDRPSIVTDPSGMRMLARAGRLERWWRWADALWDRPRSLRVRPDGNLWVRDLFKLAQVHFDRHGTMLEIEAPGPPGIMYWTYPLPIRIVGWQNLYVVHDAIPVTHPDLTPIDGARHLRLLRAVVASDGHLVAVSQAARRDVARSLGNEAAISICMTGIDIPVPDPGSGASPRGADYLLAIGSIEPRKNLERLADAYAASGTTLPLVVAGPAGWKADRIERHLATIPGIQRIAYPARSELLALLAGARMLAFPSLAEGFGLPIVEAMALGTPVITSRGGATEEIADGAALLVDPSSTMDIANAIRRLDGDDELRARLAVAGRARAAFFSTAAFAARLDALHHSLPTNRLG
jgi:glycosyltransferase involved in cell wall biosynthesis